MKKIAFSTNDRTTVEGHFGHCKEFAIFDVKDGKVLNTAFVIPPAHAPGVIPNFLKEQGIHTIITGGMGQSAIDIFKNNNIKVILGAVGSIKGNLDAYLQGQLESTGSACSHNHDKNHNCGK